MVVTADMLPEHVVKLIISYLDTRTHCTARLVSRKFNEYLTFDPNWRMDTKLVITESKKLASAFWEPFFLGKLLPHVTALWLETLDEEKARQLPDVMSRIRSLTVCKYNEGQDPDVLFNLLKGKFPNLTSLRLQVTNAQLSTRIPDILRTWPNLTRLELGGGCDEPANLDAQAGVHPEVIEAQPLEVIERLGQLEVCRVTVDWFFSEAKLAKFLLGRAASQSVLTELTLNYERLSLGSLRNGLDAMSGSLTALSLLSETPGAETNLASLLPVLVNLSKLKSIKLSSFFDCNGWKESFALMCLTAQFQLDLLAIRSAELPFLYDETAISIARGGATRNVQSLILDNPRDDLFLSETGIRALAELPQLKYLSVTVLEYDEADWWRIFAQQAATISQRSGKGVPAENGSARRIVEKESQGVSASDKAAVPFEFVSVVVCWPRHTPENPERVTREFRHSAGPRCIAIDGWHTPNWSHLTLEEQSRLARMPGFQYENALGGAPQVDQWINV